MFIGWERENCLIQWWCQWGRCVGLLMVGERMHCTLLAGDNQSTWRATCLCANVSSTRTIWSGLKWNPGLYSERLATNHLNRGMTHLLADQKSDILGIITYYIYGNKVKVTKENGILEKQLVARSQRSEILKKGTCHIDLRWGEQAKQEIEVL